MGWSTPYPNITVMTIVNQFSLQLLKEEIKLDSYLCSNNKRLQKKNDLRQEFIKLVVKGRKLQKLSKCSCEKLSDISSNQWDDNDSLMPTTDFLKIIVFVLDKF